MPRPATSARAKGRAAGGAAPEERAPYGELIRQYRSLREEQPGVILLLRLGAFYEVFFEDAEVVARELGLQLSERASGGTAPPVPQCGVPHHALDAHLARLLARGYRLAVADEDEATPETGGVRARAIVRTLTPGTVTDPRLLPADRPLYLAALVSADERAGLAWTDVAAGEFRAGEFDLEAVAAELERLTPAEILVPDDYPAPAALVAGRAVTPTEASTGATAALAQAFPAADLADVPLAQTAAGLIVRYLATTHRDDPPPLDVPQATGLNDSLRLDVTTQRHLELVRTSRDGRRAGSLLAVLDRTVTPMGARMLRAWLLRPLTDPAKIGVRQRLVAELAADGMLLDTLRTSLTRMSDLERLAGRAAARQVSVDDLRALGAVAAELCGLARVVAGARARFLRGLGEPCPALADLATQTTAVLAEPGAGAALRSDASPPLAAATAQLAMASDWQATYVTGLRRQPGLAKLELRRTSTQGLFLEVPANTTVPAGWTRRGGLKDVERYTTPELEAQAIGLAEAEAEVEAETRHLLAGLRSAAAAAAPETRRLARHLAAADALAALATVAAEQGWVAPVLTTDTRLEIGGGRHPVLAANGAFQPNDTRLVGEGETDQVVVLTGPNMAGKSTYMRQVALITLLAQIGSFVPARQATVGLVDAIYTRIGAVDDLTGGRSTFMVEMLETAAVLRGATGRSLVLLDEIGRGTSTHDGMAIAWAVLEHLATGPARPRTIAATHYHELAALRALYPQMTLLRAAVEEGPAGIAFPHRIEPGAADRSFGIEVARLAGLPPAVLERAQMVAAVVEPLSGTVAERLVASPTHGQRRTGGQPPPAAPRA